MIQTLVDSSEQPSELFEVLRSIAMAQGDILLLQEGHPNVEFIEKRRIETLECIAETFAAVKRRRDWRPWASEGS